MKFMQRQDAQRHSLLDTDGSRRRWTGNLLALTLLTAMHLPGTVALAAPQYFARPGAGVNSSPLAVLSYPGTEFGEISEAVNVMTGNVYLDLGAIGRNNLATDSDPASAFNGYRTRSTLRLAGFNTNMTAVPNEWYLGQGDGGYQIYRQAVAAEVDNSPSWIGERYNSIRHGAVFYVLAPKNGVYTGQEWIVFYQTINNRMVAHHYASNGERTTFFDDGEYADFSQTLSEQYQTANENQDVNGFAGAYKTQFTYQSVNTGRLSRVEDSWGRSSTYDWNPNGTLQAVNMLLQDRSSNATYARRIEYGYTFAFANQPYVSEITFRTYDGFGQPVSRYYNFSYTNPGGHVLLERVNKWKGANGAISPTVYTYDPQGRVSSIRIDDELPTSFAYGATDNPAAPQGTRVFWQQGDWNTGKRGYYDYTSDGWLRTVAERNYNPATGVDHGYIPTTYWYDQRGNILAVNLPTGGQLQYTYDARGNKLTEAVYTHAVNWAPTPPSGYLRLRNWAYDRDNRITSEITPIHEGSGAEGSGYRYAATSETINYGHRVAVVNGIAFKDLQSKEVTSSISDDNSKTRYLLEQYDSLGRLMSVRSSGNGLPHASTTSYDYYANRAHLSAYQAVSNQRDVQLAAGSSVVYGDMVRSRTVDGFVEHIAYDMYGNESEVRRFSSNIHSWSGSTPAYADTRTVKVWNGFGQNVMTASYEVRAGVSQLLTSSQNNFHANGELLSSWEGQPGNTTVYQYGAFGRLTAVNAGPGSGSTLSGTRTHRAMPSYDPYGRVRTVSTNGNTETYTYDTLDRQVAIAYPEGGARVTAFDHSGGVTLEQLREKNGAVFETIITRDTLGREVSRRLADFTSVISTSYDAFDRPIAVTDGRLTMLANNLDRTTFHVYDPRGNRTRTLGPALSTAASNSAGTGRS